MLQKADVAEVLAAEGRRGRARKYARLGLIASVVLVAIGVAGWWWIGTRLSAASTYSTEVVQRGTITETLVATGTLQPVQQVSVASLTTGTVRYVAVDYNQPVHAGQVLAQIDPGGLDAQLKHAMAAVDIQSANRRTADALVRDAQAALDRAEELKAGGTVSQRDLDLASTALDRARAGLAAADAQLTMAEADLSAAQSSLDKTTILSPIDGVVLDIGTRAGQTITASSVIAPLFVLASSLQNLELQVDVDEADIGRVKVGDEATFTVEAAPDQQIRGSVRQVRSGPTVADGVTSYTAVVRVNNSNLALKPGMTATAEIATAQATDVLTVANSALRFVPSGSPGGLFGLFGGSPIEAPPPNQAHVYVLTDQQPRPVPVQTGITDGIRTVVISSALQVGDTIITGAKGH